MQRVQTYAWMGVTVQLYSCTGASRGTQRRFLLFATVCDPFWLGRGVLCEVDPDDDRSQQFAEKNMRTKDEVAAYVAQHNLQEKLEAALQKVVGEQPSDPVAAIAATLTGSAGPTASSSPLLPRPRNAVGKFLRV